MRDWLSTQDGLVAELARDELDDIIRINAVILALRRRIERTVRPVAPDLIALQGCGELTAARIIAEVANIERFRSEAAFARYAGLAPIPHTSGSAPVRLRPTRQGNRRLNAGIHRIVITQTINDGSGRIYYQRRIADGDSRHRALRCLERRIARVVYNRLKGSRRPAKDSPGQSGRRLPQVFMLPLDDLQPGRERRVAGISGWSWSWEPR